MRDGISYIGSAHFSVASLVTAECNRSMVNRKCHAIVERFFSYCHSLTVEGDCARHTSTRGKCRDTDWCLRYYVIECKADGINDDDFRLVGR